MSQIGKVPDRVAHPQVGQGLLDEYEGRADNLVIRAGKSAARLVRLVTAAFPGFRDHAVYRCARGFSRPCPFSGQVRVYKGDYVIIP
jgi:hypothetical protein